MMVEPEITITVIETPNCFEVHYKREPRGEGIIYVYPDRISVDGKEYARKYISSISKKVPDSIVKQAGHIVPPARGPLEAIGRGLGIWAKQAMLKHADQTGWEVHFQYGEKSYPLAWGFGEARAQALSVEMGRLLFERRR